MGNFDLYGLMATWPAVDELVEVELEECRGGKRVREHFKVLLA